MLKLAFCQAKILRCAWCGNPESQKSAPDVMYNRGICLRCGNCVLCYGSRIAACPYNAPEMGKDGVLISRENRTECGDCADACSANAMRVVNIIIDADELTEQILVDKPHYQNSSGGVALPGGEPLTQEDAAPPLKPEDMRNVPC